MAVTKTIKSPDGARHSKVQVSEPMLKQAAYDNIVKLLNDGALRPGQLISQRELVELTGSTLGSVREAISRLEAEGLIQSLPKRGLMVPSLDIAFVRDAYQLRRILEVSAMEQAIKNIPKETIEGWIDYHLQFRDQISSKTPQELLDFMQQLDWDIHSAFIQAMGNKLIENVYRVTSTKIHMVVQSRLKVTISNAERIVGEHLAMLNPMNDGNAEEAKAALERHIDNSLTLALGGQLEL
ncbi:GntR family transcriptional regulator [uncultured Cohaesibacter sp.]|uniref:GntR family transcriptional regulator n=1 Tax=uncultured Cohaesibacter sp. TaxID=1002546 RepID=UPI00292D1C8B|nr:GntR family transcriptional regulator [uncultured Cohaesibacter sp.]